MAALISDIYWTLYNTSDGTITSNPTVVLPYADSSQSLRVNVQYTIPAGEILLGFMVYWYKNYGTSDEALLHEGELKDQWSDISPVTNTTITYILGINSILNSTDLSPGDTITPWVRTFTILEADLTYITGRYRLTYDDGSGPVDYDADDWTEVRTQHGFNTIEGSQFYTNYSLSIPYGEYQAQGDLRVILQTFQEAYDNYTTSGGSTAWSSVGFREVNLTGVIKPNSADQIQASTEVLDTINTYSDITETSSKAWYGIIALDPPAVPETISVQFVQQSNVGIIDFTYDLTEWDYDTTYGGDPAYGNGTALTYLQHWGAFVPSANGATSNNVTYLRIGETMTIADYSLTGEDIRTLLPHYGDGQNNYFLITYTAATQRKDLWLKYEQNIAPSLNRILKIQPT